MSNEEMYRMYLCYSEISVRKGFFFIFILLIILFIFATTLGLYVYFKKSDNSIDTSQTSCAFDLAPKLASSELLDKMIGHQNYQLEVNMKLTSSEINWTLLRAGNKYTLVS